MNKELVELTVIGSMVESKEHYDPDSDEFKFIEECIDYCKEESKNEQIRTSH